MEVKILEDKNNRLLLELVGETHTFGNAIRHVLWEDDHVKMSGYKVEHPLVSNPVLFIETDGKGSPRKALKHAINLASKKIEALESEFKKLKI